MAGQTSRGRLQSQQATTVIQARCCSRQPLRIGGLARGGDDFIRPRLDGSQRILADRRKKREGVCREATDVRRWLLVGDNLSEGGNVLLDTGDLIGPRAAGTVRIGNPGGVFTLGFCKMVEQDLEMLLQRGAWHRERLPPRAPLYSATSGCRNASSSLHSRPPQKTRRAGSEHAF